MFIYGIIYKIAIDLHCHNFTHNMKVVCEGNENSREGCDATVYSASPE